MARMRARRLRPVPGAVPEAGGLLVAVDASVAALTLVPGDAAVAQLARAYARSIDVAQDRPYVLEKLGPRLLRCLVSLGATPASRVPGKPPKRPPSWLDQMRAGRRPL